MLKRLIERLRSGWLNSLRKRRLSMTDPADGSEAWHIHISTARIFVASLAFVLLLFILTLSLVAYTPVLELLPGYRTEADRSRENLVQQILRLDSMERVMGYMMTYNHNIAQILDGKTPVVRSVTSEQDTARTTRILVMPSPGDSLLRAEMEGSGPYALDDREGSARQLREAMELTAPVAGIITDRFDIPQGRYGVRIAAAADERIAAIDNGTVVQCVWTPDNGYTVVLQHADNLISLYKGLSSPSVAAGQTVRRGDQLGYNAHAEQGEVRLFEFELWSNGKPVNPEEYIVFR